jgi:hypothetical protein
MCFQTRSKSFKKSVVCPLLYDGLKPADISGPLANFQHTRFTKDDFHKLVKTLRLALKAKLGEKDLDKTFEKFWPDLVSQNKKLDRTITPVSQTQRTDREMIQELVNLTRFIARNCHEITEDSEITDIVKIGKLLHIPLRELKLPKAVIETLRRHSIRNVGDLATKSEIEVLKLDGMSRARFDYLKKCLHALGLSFGMQFTPEIWD